MRSLPKLAISYCAWHSGVEEVLVLLSFSLAAEEMPEKKRGVDE